MADTPTPPASPPRREELEDRLARLTEILHRSEGLRRKTATCSLAGILVILALFLIFIMRLWGHLQESFLNDLTNHPQLFAAGLARELNLEARMKSELEKAGADLSERLPDFGRRVADALAARGDQLEEKAARLTTSLQAHAENAFESQLTAVLEGGLRDTFKAMEVDLEELKGDELEKALDRATARFTEQLANLLEDRVGAAADKLDELKKAVNRIAQLPGTDLAKLQPDEVEALLFTSLMEIVAYELVPELGAEAATGPAIREGVQP